jgi:CRISPR-associated protein Cas2
MNRLWICSYDVGDDRRRWRVARMLLGRAERVQESVFEGWLSADQLRALAERLGRESDADADRIALFPVCADCQARVRVLGQGRLPQRPHFWSV